MLRTVFVILGGFVIAVTILPFLPWKVWWVRIWDFPRFQLAVVGAVALLGAVIANEGAPSLEFWLFVGALTGVVLFQTALVWRFSRLAPFEVEQSRTDTQ